jgi:hypothetical protein
MTEQEQALSRHLAEVREKNIFGSMRGPRLEKQMQDLMQICKTIVEDGCSHGVTESELGELIRAFAKTHGISFGKVFFTGDIRRAFAIVKNEGSAAAAAAVARAKAHDASCDRPLPRFILCLMTNKRRASWQYPDPRTLEPSLRTTFVRAKLRMWLKGVVAPIAIYTASNGLRT